MGTQIQTEKNAMGKHYLTLLLGPLVFALFLVLPFEGLDFNGKVCLGMYAWMIVWWVAKPVPWLATSLLPLVIFPMLGLMGITDLVKNMFGQRIFFFFIFLYLMGMAVTRAGLAKRIAMSLLSTRWVDGKIKRFVFVYFIVAAVLQAIFGASGAAMAIPIGVSVIEYIYSEFDKQGIVINKVKFGSYVILAATYGMIAGGQMTIQGFPQNVAVMGTYTELTGQGIGYFAWMVPGLISGTLTIILAYFILHIIYKFPVTEIPGGTAYFKSQKEALGKFSTTEKRMAVVLGIVLTLWVVTTFITIPGLEFYSISYLGLILMFLVPAEKGNTAGLVTPQDVGKLNWDSIFLVTGAIGFSGLLTQFGIIDWMAQSLGGLNGIMLLVLATFLSVLMTNLLAGLATAAALSTLLLPLVMTTGIHPLVVVKLISTMTVGVMVPWAGTAAAIVYGSNHLDIKEMFKTGFIMALAIGTMLIVFNMLAMNVPAWFPPLP